MSDIISNGTGTSSVTQWLASRTVFCFSGFASFDVRGLSDPVYRHSLYESNGYSYTYSYTRDLRVRPVVSLESDIQLSGNSNDGWTIN